MEILYLLIPISVLLVFVIAAAFWWSLRSGQYDDLEGPGYRVIMDKDTAKVPATAEADGQDGRNDVGGARRSK